MNIDLIERNLKIIKSLDKSSLYKHFYDNKINIAQNDFKSMAANEDFLKF